MEPTLTGQTVTNGKQERKGPGDQQIQHLPLWLPGSPVRHGFLLHTMQRGPGHQVGRGHISSSEESARYDISCHSFGQSRSHD